ncbi:hypothetical protein M8J76_006580 [Diaphorina citri]|nr:hypothetical protein M8J76_006580 [Diaphorina citri]
MFPPFGSREPTKSRRRIKILFVILICGILTMENDAARHKRLHVDKYNSGVKNKRHHTQELGEVEDQDKDYKHKSREYKIYQENNNTSQEKSTLARKKYRLWKPLKVNTKRNTTSRFAITDDTPNVDIDLVNKPLDIKEYKEDLVPEVVDVNEKVDLNSKVNNEDASVRDLLNNTIDNQSNQSSNITALDVSNNEETAAFVGNQAKPLGIKRNMQLIKPVKQTPHRSSVDRYYLRAKLKLDSHKTSNLSYSPRYVKPPEVNIRSMLLNMKYSSMKPKSLFSQDQENIFDNLLSKTVNLKRIAVYGNVKEEKYSSEGLVFLMILMLAMLSLTVWGTRKCCQRKGDQDEIELLYKKAAYGPESESGPSKDLIRCHEGKNLVRNLEDSSYESYGSFTTSENESGDGAKSGIGHVAKSCRTMLNLTGEQVDLSNITLCKNCHLYRFKLGDK